MLRRFISVRKERYERFQSSQADKGKEKRHNSCSLKFIYLVLQTGKQSQVKHHDHPSWLLRHMWAVLCFQDICQNKCNLTKSGLGWVVASLNQWWFTVFYGERSISHICEFLFVSCAQIWHECLLNYHTKCVKNFKLKQPNCESSRLCPQRSEWAFSYSCRASVSAGIQWLAQWHFSKEDICLQGGHSWGTGTLIAAAHIFAL